MMDKNDTTKEFLELIDLLETLLKRIKKGDK